jgi:Protein of unknown function DUF262
MESTQEDDRVDDASEKEDADVAQDLRYSITSYGADYPVDALVKRMEDKAILVPDFQRKFVWSRPQASRFIESLLLGLPVPGIFLAKEPAPSQKHLVVDGQQRLRSLQRFYSGEFEEKVFTLTGVESQFEGRTYKTLADDDRLRLDDSILHATIIKQDNPADDDSSIYLIFHRLNTGGTLLHPQEIRSAVSHGAFNKLLEELNKNSSWRKIFGEDSARKKDQELILRFFALHFQQIPYKRPMKTVLDDFMASNRKFKLVPEAALREAFVPTITLFEEALGPTAFRPKGPLNAAVFDATMSGLASRLRTGPAPSPESVKAAYDALLASTAFVDAYMQATSNEDSVKSRIALATAAFQPL